MNQKIQGNLEELYKSPMLNHCPSNYDQFLVVPSILSSSYSFTLPKESLIESITNLYKQSNINAGIITVSAISALRHNTKIEFVNELQEYTDCDSELTEGGFNTIENRIIIQAQENFYSSTLIHELTHYTMYKLFSFDGSPYKNEQQKEQFYQAAKDTLANIQNYLKIKYQIDLFSSQQESTYKLAQSIIHIIAAKTGSIFQFPFWEKHYISITQDLKKYNLLDNILIEGNSLLSVAALYSKNELIKEFILSGANIENNLIPLLTQTNNFEILTWLIDNNININTDGLTCQGKNALDYASSPEMIKTLISAGAVAYPNNYKDICPILEKCNSSKIKTELLDMKAIAQLLNFSIDSYDQKYEPAELIAYFVETISSSKYKDVPLKNITKPLYDYFENIINPTIQEYLQLNGINDSDTMQLDYYNFYNP